MEDAVFECFEVDNGRFVGFSYQPEDDKHYRLEGKINPLSIDKVKLIDTKTMTLQELINSTDKIDYIKNGNPYFLIHTDEELTYCDYVSCRPQVMLNANGTLKCNSLYDIYYHDGEGKFWAVTTFQNNTFVMFKNDITERKWVFMAVNGSPATLAQAKEAKGYTLLGTGSFKAENWDFEII